MQVACAQHTRIQKTRSPPPLFIAHLKRYHYPIFSEMEVSSHDTSPLDVAIHRADDKKISRRFGGMIDLVQQERGSF